MKKLFGLFLILFFAITVNAQNIKVYFHSGHFKYDMIIDSTLYVGDELLPLDSGTVNLGSSALWWDTLFVNDINVSGNSIIIDNDVILSVPSPNYFHISDTTVAYCLVADTGGIQTKDDIVPIDSGVVNVGASNLYFDTIFVNHWVGDDAELTYYLGFIDSTDINAEAASSTTTITLSAASIPTGYSITALWVETEEAWVSATRGLLFTDVKNNSPSYALLQTLPGDAFTQIANNLVTLRMFPPYNTGKDDYSSGIDVNVEYESSGNNPQDFSAGKTHFWLKLEKAPTAP